MDVHSPQFVRSRSVLPARPRRNALHGVISAPANPQAPKTNIQSTQCYRCHHGWTNQRGSGHRIGRPCLTPTVYVHAISRCSHCRSWASLFCTVSRWKIRSGISQVRFSLVVTARHVGATSAAPRGSIVAGGAGVIRKGPNGIYIRRTVCTCSPI
jgi:hypothetical protein